MSSQECNGNCIICYVTGYLSLTKSVFCVVFILLIMASMEESTIMIYKSYVTVDPVLLTMLLILSVVEMFLAPLLISGLNTEQVQFIIPWLLLYAAYQAILIFLVCSGWKKQDNETKSSEDSQVRFRVLVTLGSIFFVQLYLMVCVSARVVSMLRRPPRRSSNVGSSNNLNQRALIRVRDPGDLPPSYEMCLMVETSHVLNQDNVDQQDFAAAAVECTRAFRTLRISGGRRRSHGLVPETPPPSYSDCSFPFKGSPSVSFGLPPDCPFASLSSRD